MKKNQSGVITVEAALIMPIILGVIFLIYSLALIQFQNISVRTVAMQVANRAAMNWNTLGEAHSIMNEDSRAAVYFGEESDEIGKTGQNAISSENFAEHDPYRYFIELFYTGNAKENNMNDYLKAKMKKIGKIDTGISSEMLSSGITGDGGICNRYIEVKIENAYQSPILEFLDKMGISINRKYSITAKAKMTEPTDFLRNVSYVQELLRNWGK